MAFLHFGAFVVLLRLKIECLAVKSQTGADVNKSACNESTWATAKVEATKIPIASLISQM